jgi:hypothetical protein
MTVVVGGWVVAVAVAVTRETTLSKAAEGVGGWLWWLWLWLWLAKLTSTAQQLIIDDPRILPRCQIAQSPTTLFAAGFVCHFSFPFLHEHARPSFAQANSCTNHHHIRQRIFTQRFGVCDAGPCEIPSSPCSFSALVTVQCCSL